jgi:hypothetical protein
MPSPFLENAPLLVSIEITFEKDRQRGVLNGPRAYFHDPDSTVLEFIDLTSYAGNRLSAPASH